MVVIKRTCKDSYDKHVLLHFVKALTLQTQARIAMHIGLGGQAPYARYGKQRLNNQNLTWISY